MEQWKASIILIRRDKIDTASYLYIHVQIQR